MSEKKLPKGVKTISEVASSSGKGGALLRSARRHLTPGGPNSLFPGSPTMRGKAIGGALYSTRDNAYTAKHMASEHRLELKERSALNKRIDDIDLFTAHGSKMNLAARASKVLGIVGIPMQYLEFREAIKKPKLHEREQKAAARRM